MRLKTGTMVREKDIVETLTGEGSFGIFVKCLRATDLVKYLADTDTEFTVFAPNDAAFKKLSDEGVLKDLLDDQVWLSRVVRYHIVRGRVRIRHVDGNDLLVTLLGQTVLLSTTGEIVANRSHILRRDIECENGVIHEIDAVMLIPRT